MALWVNYRPEHLPPPPTAMLNPEPAAPEEREAQHLPPKSYADAAEEALEPQSHASHNDTDSVAEGTAQKNHIQTDGSDVNHVGILRIVKPNGQQDNDQKPATESTKESSSKESSIEDQESYEGTGIDETPKSPKAKTHVRKGSRSSLGSIGRTYGVSIKNDLKNAASDARDKSTDLVNEDERKHEMLTQGAQKNKQNLDGTLLQEKPRLVNGDSLTTVKPSKEIEKDSRIDKPLKRRNSELKAGRQAGAGWAKSKYVLPIHISTIVRLLTAAG